MSGTSWGGGARPRDPKEEKQRPKAKKELLASVQNLPAVLTDPRKGKQRDFFTRHWGEDFTEHSSIPPSPFVCELPSRTFERYLKKLHKHCPRHSHARPRKKSESSARNQQRVRISSGSAASVDSSGGLSSVPHVFLDPNFDLNNPDTLGQIFPFLRPDQYQKDTLSHQIERSGRLIQEKLGHHLDTVEVNIAGQVAQKSHHFFQVMTYHDALMNQLTSLVKNVDCLRKRLQEVDANVFQVSLNVCRLTRQKKNLSVVLEKLSMMSSLHQTQPTIQLLLSGNEFSGALDLITTSRDILTTDLRGVQSFKHLSCQLEEIQSIIGKMLLGDFQTYITAEVSRDIVQTRATSLEEKSVVLLEESESEQLKSVIYGLLRQNSYTFLELLEEASIAAVKSTFRDVAKQILSAAVGSEEMTLTNMSADFARKASSDDWVDFFDILLGSLIFLLKRIHAIHSVIMGAIETANKSNELSLADSSSSNAIAIPERQLEALKSTSQEVLVNVCDQVVERSSKILTQRSRTGAAKQITTRELKFLSRLVELLNNETLQMTGKVSSGLQLSLQGQALLYVQAFDESKRIELSNLLEREKWKRSNLDFFEETFSKMKPIECLCEAFESKKQPVNGKANSHSSTTVTSSNSQEEEEEENASSNGIVASDNEEEDLKADTANHCPESGDIVINDETYSVTDSAHLYLIMLSEYCLLCSDLPGTSVELGLKTADLMKLYNSRVCQLVIGAGAISVSGLKTITIRNLALAQRSVQLIMAVIPYVRKHFEQCHKNRLASNKNNNNNVIDSPTSSAENKQLEMFRRQFDQAYGHLKNHSDEVQQKILTVVEQNLSLHLTAWQPQQSAVPSAHFKALCKQLTKVFESVSDVWPPHQNREVMLKVHQRFIEAVKSEIRLRRLRDPASPQSRSLLSELTFYSQSLLRLEVIPPELLTRDAMENIWTTL